MFDSQKLSVTNSGISNQSTFTSQIPANQTDPELSTPADGSCNLNKFLTWPSTKSISIRLAGPNIHCLHKNTVGRERRRMAAPGPQQWMMSAQPQPSQVASSTGPFGYHQPTSLEEVRTLWIGDLQYWVDESYLTGCFSHTGEVLSIKVIRNKQTGQLEGYGFIEFNSHAAAERVLQTYNGALMPGTELTFRLNWASFGMGERRAEAGPDHSIFVGDLAPDVTDYLLQETFRVQYPSVRSAKVVTDTITGCSKGYGFVKFAEESERNRAMLEMNGVYCSTRPMRISAATPKKATGITQQYAPAVKGIELNVIHGVCKMFNSLFGSVNNIGLWPFGQTLTHAVTFLALNWPKRQGLRSICSGS